MVYPKFIIPEEKIFEIDDSRLPLFNSYRRSHPWQRSCFFLQANCFLLRLQSSFFYSSTLHQQLSAPLSLFPLSTVSSLVFTLHQQRHRSLFFPQHQQFSLQTSKFSLRLAGFLFSLHRKKFYL
ncbi:hypothetical protein POPTR_006G062150v4 [Populus trichocarpa]|jgi:hypothetical protein|uniref:Uncharacterized protein n=1 Tax=Populus trichocarpa TaxID=3694 RepID=U5G979_POPTR|nr:hypothetical protein POPTR_006G062150v4 [Populus trichocarpa]